MRPLSVLIDGDHGNTSARNQVIRVLGAVKTVIVALALFAFCGVAQSPKQTMKSARRTKDASMAGVMIGGVPQKNAYRQTVGGTMKTVWQVLTATLASAILSLHMALTKNADQIMDGL